MPELRKLADQYGASLSVDDAHATGVCSLYYLHHALLAHSGHTLAQTLHFLIQIWAERVLIANTLCIPPQGGRGQPKRSAFSQFLDAIASPSTYPCQSVSEWGDSFRSGHSYRISELCELVFIGPRCPWGPIYGSGCH